MNRPLKILERFERNYGDFYQILAQYPSGDEAKDRKLRGLMTEHNKLVAAYVGYIEGVRDCKNGVAE